MEEYLFWSAPESHHVPKSPAWYLWNALIVLIVTVIAIWQKNLTFLIFVAVAEAIIIGLASRRPRELLHAISNEGIALAPEGLSEEKLAEEGEFFPYSEFEAFAAHENPTNDRYAELVFRRKQKLSTYLKILISYEKLTDAQQVLIHFLPEFEYEESLADHILKKIGL
ncbi:MAG: hypothetical protein COU11_01740 [Candidatus Harrisonbacteria bacterium CG10_big_fil_rev_8_21_14_0_10_49_15]|uniref:DUF5673 domain-containing protein n=1 Tax=Candidatus Harrisonbacteria bacterium CG10_big_fil_rev_8_21_14_0_10_49_15 TaxID=1974587 RepID=A0A2H0ULA8_9BACT|nr:MAG: hypothetical protein COU11_01740 [Candidatus Harrisonbacteria bacterium CG10_big_fil_rev_8_21_14_0_10_49_15]